MSSVEFALISVVPEALIVDASAGASAPST
jgi:hypothetical protein